MKIEVIGSGSAFSTRRNTSAVMVTDNKDNQWLIDCGPTIPRALWQRGTGVNDIQVIYFTHIHPDHCSGLAALVNQWKSVNRTVPLTLYCQAEHRAPLESLLFLASWPKKTLGFDIHWRDISDQFDWQDWQISTAFTQHEVRNRCLRIDTDQQSF